MNKHQNQLSPEKYIRTKARTLPIGPCYINPDWQMGKAMITVTRIHINQNVTFALFLVDIFCLGVKNASWYFNLHTHEFQDFMDNQREGEATGLRIVETDYLLVHNIIWGGLAFAEEFGLKPHPDFAVAKYILEEDNDTIQLIDIPFGFKEKPLFVSNPGNPYEKNRVLAHLKTIVGEGNFYHVTEEEADDFLAENDADDDTDYQDPQLKQEIIVKFVKGMKTRKKLLATSDLQVAEFLKLADLIFYHYMTTKEELDQADEMISKLFDFKVSSENFSEALLFGKQVVKESRHEIKREAERLSAMIFREENTTMAKEQLHMLQRKFPGVVVFEYLALRLRELTSSVESLIHDIHALMKKEPDYLPVLYMYAAAFILTKPDDVDNRMMSDSMHLINIDPQRPSFFKEEVRSYIQALSLNYLFSDNITMSVSLLRFLTENYPDLLSTRILITTKIGNLAPINNWCMLWLAENKGS